MPVDSAFIKSLRNPWQWVKVGVIILFLGTIAVPGIFIRPVSDYGNSAGMQNARTIGLIMFQYSVDHDGKYPSGKSSTEIFQKLIDEKYVNDPAIFYLKMPGKTKATSNMLKPENVSWDITAPLDASASDQMPLVFLTGYKIDYVPDGNAVPIPGKSRAFNEGMAVCYKGNNASFQKSDGKSGGIIYNFVPPSFDPAGKKYQQLTPDGPLP